MPVISQGQMRTENVPGNGFLSGFVNAYLIHQDIIPISSPYEKLYLTLHFKTSNSDRCQ